MPWSRTNDVSELVRLARSTGARLPACSERRVQVDAPELVRRRDVQPVRPGVRDAAGAAPPVPLEPLGTGTCGAAREDADDAAARGLDRGGDLRRMGERERREQPRALLAQLQRLRLDGERRERVVER